MCSGVVHVEAGATVGGRSAGASVTDSCKYVRSVGGGGCVELGQCVLHRTTTAGIHQAGAEQDLVTTSPAVVVAPQGDSDGGNLARLAVTAGCEPSRSL